MRLPLFWMTDYVDPQLAPAELAERLAMTGTEVDRVYTHGVTALENFVVGRVLEREQHPDADRLSVCQVAIGEGDVSTIVCGAPAARSSGSTMVPSWSVPIPTSSSARIMPLEVCPRSLALLSLVPSGMVTSAESPCPTSRKSTRSFPSARPLLNGCEMRTASKSS